MVDLKHCKRCGDDKPHSEFYPRKWKTSKGVERLGLYPWCKTCAVAQKGEYYQANREAVDQRGREWRKKNPEKAHATDARQGARSKERHPKAQVEAVRWWEAKNPEKTVEMRKRAVSKFHGRNPLYDRQRSHRRRVQLLRGEGSWSEKDFQLLAGRYEGLCAYCQERPVEQVEHVVPLSRGGSNYIGNILPVCRPCNQSKGRRLLIEWAPDRKSLGVTRA